MNRIIATFIILCCYVQSSISQNASIIGKVWIDFDYNFLYDGENGVVGLKVYLIDANSNIIIDSTQTSVIDFHFPSSESIIIPPGNYYLEVPADEFNPGGALQNYSSCYGVNEADNGIDNDDNGSDELPLKTTTFSLDTSLVEHVDLCFLADCDQEIPSAKENCNDITEIDVFCSISELNNLCGLMSTNISQGDQPMPLCLDGGAAHNISWFAFVADEGNYAMTFTPTGCTGSTTGQEGVQMGVYTDCSFAEAVYCDPTCNVNTLTIESEVLTPGQTYYFFIDGCSGSVCSYVVEIVGNLSPPTIVVNELCIIDDGNTVCEDLELCSNEEILFEADVINYGFGYSWQITTLSGNPYMGNPNPETEDNNIEIIFTNTGIYQVCLSSIDHPCNDLSWNGNTCRTITINNSTTNEIFDTISLCLDSVINFDINLLATEDPNQDGVSGWVDADYEFSFGNNVSTVEDSYQCEYTQAIFINELEGPQISLNPNANLLCIGDTLNFSLSINENYDSITWFVNNIQQTDSFGMLFPEVGEYNFMTNIYNDCGEASDQVIVQVLDTISAPSVTCDSSNVGMIVLSWPTVEGVEGYWLSINGDSSILLTDSSYVIEDLGAYEEVSIEFNLVDSTKCVGPNISFVCTSKMLVGIQDQQIDDIKIVPNPASDFITIEDDMESSNSTFMIYTINGKLLYADKLDQSNRINVSQLPSGLYFLTMMEVNQEVRRVGRFVKM